MIGNGAKIADKNPAATLGAPDVIVSSFLWGTAQTLGEMLSAENMPHRNASLIRSIE
jgi:hypothetical protein